LTLVVRSPDEVQAVFDADAVEQILGNLLSNVEKYAAGSGEVVVTVSDDGSVEVRDHGPGVEASDTERVFEPFYRSRSDLTEGVSGTGLGLSIARTLAGAQNGSLRIVAADSGATFVLQLPIVKP
jgi:signal transduction histidine kinase